ncbi:DNA repair protein RecN [Actinomyces culturomici]|uniref:DNA repair protein RecN n=1 Tax=Actinomyces culturomici TaxID=1926276 RepID=UPI000E20BD98|nr:DNA repair protein RecN [Actinomyces culturomici]
MISSIEISGLGVIDRAVLEFGDGLTVLTGETGAGKTMVLTSVDLLLGGRADPALVRAGAASAQIDGVIVVGESDAERAREAGAEVEDGELIVSRTVASQGRSRARLGGRPVPASILSEVVSPLLTVHGQAEQMRLKAPAAQRELLDAFGGAPHTALLEEYAVAWREAVSLKRLLDEVEAGADDREREAAELEEALGAIDALDVHAGEDEELRAEARRLMNVEDLRRFAGAAGQMLAGTEDADGAAGLLRMALEQVRGAERLDDSLADLASRFDAAIIDVETLADDVRAYARSLDADPARLAAVHARRAALKSLLEGRAADAAELLDWASRARARLSELRGAGTDPALVRDRLHEAQARVLEVGGRLSAARRGLASRLAAAVDVELHALAMKDAALEISVGPAKPNSHGLDDIAILLRPHPSAQARPLGQGASGGELSRIMLALEVILGEHDRAETFVFDEVDAGIGGRTANEVGARLARLAANRQVVVVTHLPQVAVFATTHLVVSKEDGRTSVRRVEGEERDGELTRMMGGDPHSPAARRHAIEVLTSGVSQSQG